MTTSAYLRAANQPPPLEGYDLFSEDLTLVEALRREGAVEREEECVAFGRLCGGRPLELGRLANENPPVLRRDDEVEFHPAWHELLRLGVEHGLHAFPWEDPGPAPHVARAAKFMTLAYAEAGVGCPLSMTYAAVPALRHDSEVSAEWAPRLASRAYDPTLSADKSSALVGMSLTERQGGSDVRANETRAEPAGDGYLLTGQKWFCSAPMCDAFLVLAQAPGGLTCFLLPRMLADGTRNGFHIERLKDKLGNRSNASAEIELREAWAARLGDEGRGIATIIEMVVHTRLDCVLGSAALQRRAVAEAGRPRFAQLDLRGGVRAVPELVLQPLDVEAVPRAVRQHAREHEAREAAGRLREDEKRVAHGRRAEPLLARQHVPVAGWLGPRLVGAHVRAPLAFGERHAHERRVLLGRQLRVIRAAREPRRPLLGEVGVVAQGGDGRVRHRERAADTGFGVGEGHEPRGADDVRRRLGILPRECVQPVLDAETQELVPGGVELDLVVAPEHRRALVREASELERPAAAEPAEGRALVLALGSALAPERLDQRQVLGEEVVALERRRLVCGPQVRGRRHRRKRAGWSLRRQALTSEAIPRTLP